jgi:hypothetical protein
MDQSKGWPAVLRLVWLSGGLVAISPPASPLVEVKAGDGGRDLFKLEIPSFAALYEALKARGLPVIGATFYQTQEELAGLLPPDFRAGAAGGDWRAWDGYQKWRQVVFGASQSENLRLMEVASRIAFGLQYSEMRLLDLATAYSKQLRGRLHKEEVKDYQGFKDANSGKVYRAIHALFWEMAVLRDACAEFFARFCLSCDGVTAQSSLCKWLKKNPSSDPLAQEIQRISDKDQAGWLARFGSYRDCFTHSAPLEQAAGLAMAIQDLRVLSDGTSIPQIYYALPADIDDLTRSRSKGQLFNSVEELAKAVRRRHDRAREPDALEYLHGCLDQMTGLASKLIARSPVEPRMLHFTEKDIIRRKRG